MHSAPPSAPWLRRRRRWSGTVRSWNATRSGVRKRSSAAMTRSWARALSLKELDVFKVGLGALADGELKLEEAIAQALENVKKRQEDVRKAREAARQAQHETVKIVTPSGHLARRGQTRGRASGRFGNGRIQTAAASGDRRRALGAFHPRRGRKHWGKGRETFLERRFFHPASSNLPIRKLSRSFQCLLCPLCSYGILGIERRLER